MRKAGGKHGYEEKGGTGGEYTRVGKKLVAGKVPGSISLGPEPLRRIIPRTEAELETLRELKEARAEVQLLKKNHRDASAANARVIELMRNLELIRNPKTFISRNTPQWPSASNLQVISDYEAARHPYDFILTPARTEELGNTYELEETIKEIVGDVGRAKADLLTTKGIRSETKARDIAAVKAAETAPGRREVSKPRHKAMGNWKRIRDFKKEK
jgi:hypothetical protein